MSPPDRGPGRLKASDNAPAFTEPWQAQVLAMADLLVAAGQFSAARWADALGAEIKATQARGAADESEAYFGAALSALERLLAEDGSVSLADLEAREHAWEHAYLDTPHGQPVILPGG